MKGFFSFQITIIFTFLLFILLISCKKESFEGVCEKGINELPINQLQIIGSHNSYRLKTYDPLFEHIKSLEQLFPDQIHSEELDYWHESIADQLEIHGVRSLELDVYYDPEGGAYSNRMGLQLIGEPVAANIPELENPGYKVLHLLDFDYETRHFTLQSALTALKSWSDNRPDHLPLFILIEPKDNAIDDALEEPISFLTRPAPITPEALNDLDQEIIDIFGQNLSRVITPDEVRGTYNSLNAAVQQGNWPNLKEAKGKLFFILITSGQERENYLKDHPSLEDRVMFTFSQPGEADCAFVKLDDPLTNEQMISELVRQGYIVRTRADEGTLEARTGDYTRAMAALNSGAQIISTDFYRPDPRNDTSSVWTDYQVAFDQNHTARHNPVNGRMDLKDCSFED